MRNNTSKTGSPTITIVPSVTPSSTPHYTPAPMVSTSQSQSPIDEDFLRDYNTTEARGRPDLTVNNNAPYENDSFRVETLFVSTDPGYFKIIVSLKKNGDQSVKQEVTDWLRSLGIPDESIQQLRIEFVPDI